MDQSRAPLLEALADYHRSERYGFSPPGHRQGRGTDERALAVLGKDPFRDDVVANGGLDDRMAVVVGPDGLQMAWSGGSHAAHLPPVRRGDPYAADAQATSDDGASPLAP